MKKFSSTFMLSTLMISAFSGSVVPLNALADQTSTVHYKEPIYYNEVNVNLTQVLSSSYTITLNTAYSISEDDDVKLDPGKYTVRKNGSKIDLIKGTSTIYSGESFNIFPITYSLDSYVTFANNYSYLGDFKFQSNADGVNVRVINSLPTEHYLYGVVPYEMSESWASSGGLEALKAQAVAARTYTMKRILNTLSDTTSDQVYKGYNKSNANSIKAVDQTQGVYITSNGQPIDYAFYSSTNGGHTMSVPNVYNNSDVSYLQYKYDYYDTLVDSHKNWGFTLNKVQVAGYDKLTSQVGTYDMSKAVEADNGTSVLEGLRATIKSTNKIPSSMEIKILNIPKLSFSTVNSNTTSLDKLKGVVEVEYAVYNKTTPKQYKIETFGAEQRSYNFYTGNFFGKTGTLPNFRSANVSVSSLSNGIYTVKGNGWGHGMGMSQWGAYERSKAGYSYAQILQFYYDNTVLTSKVNSAVYQNQSNAPILKYNGATFADNVMTANYEVDQNVPVQFYLDGKLIGTKNTLKGKNSIKMDVKDFTAGTHTLKIVVLHEDADDINTSVNVIKSEPTLSYTGVTFNNDTMTANYNVSEDMKVHFYLDDQLIGSKNTLKGKNSIKMDVKSFKPGTHSLKIVSFNEFVKDTIVNIAIPNKAVILPKLTYTGSTLSGDSMTTSYTVDQNVTVHFYLDDKLIGSKNTLKGKNSIKMSVKGFTTGTHKLKIQMIYDGTSPTTSTVTIKGTATTVNKTTVNTNAASKITHKVVKGDTLWSISQKYKVSVASIQSLNKLSSTALFIGQVLKIY